MCYYFQQPGYCYPAYAYNCYPGYPSYPEYPNYPNYNYQTITTVTYPGYSTYSNAAETSPATSIALTPTGGTTVYDVWLTITPLQGGEFTVVLTAQGLQPGSTYMIEGITLGTHMSIVPLTPAAADSEFAADNQGNGIYSHIFAIDPITAYTGVLLLYLPNNQIEGSVLVASATLG